MEYNFRTFICIDFPSKVIKEVARIQTTLEKQNFTGKLTELENLHITLKFLGEISQKKLSLIKNKLSDISFPELNLKLSHIGTFSIRKNPKIVWLKVTGKIFELQKKIDINLSTLFPKEERFMSHLTIARIKYVKNKLGFSNYVSKIKPSPLSFKVNNFKLKTSELKPNGPIYSTIKTYKSNI